MAKWYQRNTCIVDEVKEYDDEETIVHCCHNKYWPEGATFPQACQECVLGDCNVRT